MPTTWNCCSSILCSNYCMVLLNLLQLVADMVAADIMLPCELCTSRTSHKVGLKSLFEVLPKFAQNWPKFIRCWPKLRANLTSTNVRILYEVVELCTQFLSVLKCKHTSTPSVHFYKIACPIEQIIPTTCQL